VLCPGRQLPEVQEPSRAKSHLFNEEDKMVWVLGKVRHAYFYTCLIRLMLDCVLEFHDRYLCVNVVNMAAL
jgi:hypothetical protein